MNYYSLNQQSPKVSFAEAALRGQAPDKGLYFPEFIPKLSDSFIKSLKDKSLSKTDIGFTVMQPFIGDSIPEDVLKQIVSETINFDFPLINITDNIASLELFHGPTLAFKDVGARFMSRCLGYLNRHAYHQTTVLVATSGDTGGAVANGFLGVDGVEVIILYPSGKVSPIQELQLTTLGKNIQAIEVAGTFDDCQAMVKQAFVDVDLNNKLSLTSANSINVARWLPQQLYYFYAYQQWLHDELPVICVPSGNFGNICAGIVAFMGGLPVKHFIAACNANDVVPNYMLTKEYAPKPAIATVSNAMDVGNPSNFIRILALFQQQFEELKNMFTSVSISDKITVETIESVYKNHHYTLDPHGAVAYYALEQYLTNEAQSHHEQTAALRGMILETAHPVKFPDTVEKAINKTVEIPEQVRYLLNQQKKSILMDTSFESLKEWLMNR